MTVTMKTLNILAAMLAAVSCAAPVKTADDTKTTFQTSRAWMPEIDNRADAVMVYGVGGNPSDKNRVNLPSNTASPRGKSAATRWIS